MSKAVKNLAKAMRQNAINFVDEFGNKMKGRSVRDFKEELVDNGQRSDVYRHVMFVASTYLDDSSTTRVAFKGFDKQQALRGRKQSETEARDNAAGTEVGKLMLNVVKAVHQGQKPDFNVLYESIRGVLCKTGS